MLRIRLNIYEYCDHWKADIENGLVDTAGEGEGGTNWESGTEMYTSPSVEQTASGKLPYNTGSLAGYSAMTYRGRMGWMGQRITWEGMDVYLELIHSVEQQKPTQYYKATIF